MKRNALLLMLACLLLAGCKAGAQYGASAMGKPAPLNDEQIYSKMQPFLECSYVEFGRIAPDRGYNAATADQACQTCSPMLSIYEDFLMERTRNRTFAKAEAAGLMSYAKEVILQGTGRSTTKK